MTQAAGDPARFCKILGQLFDTMATGGDFGLEPIRHFNGNQFDPPSRSGECYGAAGDPPNAAVPALTADDPNTRAQLGAHFTGREDIGRVVDAVVMAPLRREWAETKAIAERLLELNRRLSRDDSTRGT